MEFTKKNTFKWFYTLHKASFTIDEKRISFHGMQNWLKQLNVLQEHDLTVSGLNFSEFLKKIYCNFQLEMRNAQQFLSSKNICKLKF